MPKSKSGNSMVDSEDRSIDIFAQTEDYPAEQELQDEEARYEKKNLTKKRG